jgi:hypothetical protein
MFKHAHVVRIDPFVQARSAFCVFAAINRASIRPPQRFFLMR